ncbi:uncharacterized protein LOC143211993 isoform X2 [Lasioglossum baleicum]|uniref:uncharacterized protein LOC143211993 isoform X2 n=1 Tax=Lasioglossum baleicum TaxID=434251 RepID=UPI003FCD429F
MNSTENSTEIPICFSLEDLEDTRSAELRRISYGIILPTVCCLGIVGNILNLVVLTRRNMRGVAYIYMRGYSMAALLAISFCIPFALRVLNHKEGGRWTNWVQAFYHAHLELFLGNGCLDIQGGAGGDVQSGPDDPASKLQPSHNDSLQTILPTSEEDDAIENPQQRRRHENVRGGTKADASVRQHQPPVPRLRQPDGDFERDAAGEHSQPLSLPGVPGAGELARGDQLLDDVLHLLSVLRGFPEHLVPDIAMALGTQQPEWKGSSDGTFSPAEAHDHHHQLAAADHRYHSRPSLQSQRLGEFVTPGRSRQIVLGSPFFDVAIVIEVPATVEPHSS